jgi:ribosomal protein S18 acetylase RimI-like enzyme
VLIDDGMEIIRAELIHLGDAAFLFDQYRQFYQQKSDVEGVLQFLEERIRNNESIIFLAYAEDKPVGFMQLYPTFSSISIQRAWVLNDLFVDVDYRHSGVGSALLDAASAYGKKTNAKYLMLQTGSENFPAQRLYESKQWKKDTDLFYRFDLG